MKEEDVSQVVLQGAALVHGALVGLHYEGHPVRWPRPPPTHEPILGGERDQDKVHGDLRGLRRPRLRPDSHGREWGLDLRVTLLLSGLFLR